MNFSERNINANYSLKIFMVLGMYLFFNSNITEAQYVKKGFSPKRRLKDLSITYWTTDHGLPSNNVNEISQSPDGYIWVASFEGFIKFDGLKFSVVDHKKKKDDNYIGGYSVYFDDNNQLWACTLGKGLFKYNGKLFHQLEYKEKLPQSTRRVYKDSKQNFWIGGINQGLYCKRDTQIVKIDYSFLDDVTIQSIQEDKKGTIWFGTEGKGISYLENGKYKTIRASDGLLSDFVLFVLPDENNTVWIGTTRGLQKFTNNKLTVVDPIREMSVRKILKDDYGFLWLATTKGIIRLNPETYETEAISEEHGLPDKDISSLVFDKEGSLWVASARRGIIQLKPTSFLNLTDKSMPFLHKINIVSEDSDGTILIGSDNGKVYRYKNEKFKELKIKSNLSGLRIRNIYRDRKGYLWISSYAGVVIKKGNVEKLFNVKNGMPTDQARVIFEDTEGQVWVGTRNGGIVKFKDYEIQSVIDSKDGLSSNFIMSLSQDLKGNLIVSTVGGGVMFIDQEGKIETFRSEHGISDEVVFNTFTDKKGAVWIADNKGLTRFFNNQFVNIRNTDGLIIDRPFDYLEDNLGYSWVSSAKGIVRINKKQMEAFTEGKTDEIEAKLFDNDDGMIAKDCIGATKSFKSSNGTLWFPTVKGVTYINPTKVLKNKIIPPVMILDLKVDNAHVPLKENIELASSTKHYLFEFTALSLIAPSKVRFKYILEGFDQEWLVPEHNDRYVAYTNLPYGNYTFKVIASNNSGLWNEKGAQLSFYVKPAFHETPMFYFIIVVVMILILWLGVNYRTNLIRKKSQLLKKLVAERTEEIREQKQEIEAQSDKLLEANLLIQSKNEALSKSNMKLEDTVFKRTHELRKALKELDQFIYRTAHDLMGPVARLVGLCQIAKIEPNQAMIMEYVKTIEANSIDMKSLLSRLMRSQDVKFEEPTITKIDFKELIDSIYETFSERPFFEKVDFSIDTIDNIEFYSDKLMLSYLLENLIDNCFNYIDEKKEHNYIKIEISQGKDHECKIDVIDNGIGIIKEVSGKIYEMFYRGTEHSTGFGLGLYESKLIVKKLGGKIWHRKSNKKETEFLIYLPSKQEVAYLSELAYRNG